jgi:hypothetical protein
MFTYMHQGCYCHATAVQYEAIILEHVMARNGDLGVIV